MFSYNTSILTLNSVTRQITLKPKVFVSCTLNFQYGQTSVYHGSMGSIEEGIYRPDDDSLPSVEITTLEARQVALTRKAHPQEYIQSLWPVFYADKVSFTCKDAIKIKISNM